MIDAVSDLHGCYDKFIKMLDKINFSVNDTLYILGDVVDRGKDGIKILQYIMNTKNIVPLVGNHDFTAKIMLKTFGIPNDGYDSERLLETYKMWLFDGGSVTYDAFMELDDAQKRKILSYLNSFQIYEELELNGKKFFLSHTVPEKERFDDFKSLLWQEFIVGEPDYDKKYSEDKFIVTGHTPTGLIDPEYAGKIYKKNNHIAIDCGAVFGNPLGCICLDTLEEFYVEE